MLTDDDLVNLQKYEGYDDAILGAAEVWTEKGVKLRRLCYSADLIIEIMVMRDGMGFDDALEYIEVNLEGGYTGQGMPIIIWDTSY